MLFSDRTYIMGILNVTPDSFSDGGKFFSLEKAAEQAQKMIEEGADIIDVGGESTRPGAGEIGEGEEIGRVAPVISEIRKIFKGYISIDTRKSKVAEAALKAGANFINDVSGLKFDKKMAKVAADFKVLICLMHSRGNPENMQQNPVYKDVVAEVLSAVRESIAIAKDAGILHNRIIIDPGIGFGKTLEHNLEILAHLSRFKELQHPIMIGVSRKSFIGQILNAPVAGRLEGTLASVVWAVGQGASIVRVHDVGPVKKALLVLDRILKEGKDHEKEKN